MAKYDGFTRGRVWGAIKAGMDKGEQPYAITEKLRGLNLFMPDGTTPMQLSYVSKVMVYLAKRKPGLTVTQEAKAPERLPHTVIGILTDPTLSAGQKVRMISAYADIGE